MNIESFSRFLKTGTVKKQNSDIPRAESLISESKNRYIFLKEIIKKIGLDEKNTNYIVESVYDILIELIRAKMLIGGFKASGHSAHAAEVSYMEIMGFSEEEMETMDRLRHFRNRIKYYGKKLPLEYAEKIINFLEKTYIKLGSG